MPGLDASNTFFRLAADMVNHTSKNIFLTGKAGTGKTTFLTYIKKNCPKQAAIVAPTGVAAINAGGVTIHSFFQLPLSPFIPGDRGQVAATGAQEIVTKHSLLGKIKLTAAKREVLQSLELLIIDEISMVRCDILDAIDTVLRYFRSRHFEPFGGVQLLLIGDMYQLPPVITEQNWEILSQFYNSPYFFSSYVIQEHPPAFISFEKIYRQSDLQFIELLNQVRNNEMDEAAMQLLHSRYQRDFRPAKEEGYIILTTHNYRADTTNIAELNNLTSPLYSFKAVIEGEFSDKAFPADDLLKIKKGAQVMFLRNDVEKDRRYYNGKIGTVKEVDNENIFVQCKNETAVIEVSKEKWENIRYTFNGTTRQLEEEVIGSFTQFPLRLAWAITIHKSQGLTFEKAIVDAGAAFAPGQVYVALSRCTNFEGLVLHSRIPQSSIQNDERIVSFSQNNLSLLQLQDQLIEAKHLYQQVLLLNLFQLSGLVQITQELLSLLNVQATSFNPKSLPWAESLFTQIKALEDVSQKFRSHLRLFFQDTTLPEQNAALQNRLVAAANYFEEQVEKYLSFLKQSSVSTNNRALAKQYNDKLFTIHSLLAEKKFMFEFCKNGFDASVWKQIKDEFKIPLFSIDAYAASPASNAYHSSHPELYKQLHKKRDDICAKINQPADMVAGNIILDKMAAFLPQNFEELSKISGFKKGNIEAYGQHFINIINQYCSRHRLNSHLHKKFPEFAERKATPQNPDSKLATLKFHKAGKSVKEIASIRNLGLLTIQGHLAHFVKKGEVKIDDVLSREKLFLIESAIKNSDGNSLLPVKSDSVIQWALEKSNWYSPGMNLKKNKGENSFATLN